MEAIAERLAAEEAEMVILDYARRHPLAMRELSGFLGNHLDGSEASLRALGRDLPIFALKPVSSR